MITAETDLALANLARIEAGLARIYAHLSGLEHFSGPVRKFWAALSEEELKHEKVFLDIREKARADDSFQFEVEVKVDDLKAFIEKVNKLRRETFKKNLTEDQAYSFGAMIEAELDEGRFTGKIKTNDLGIKKRLKQVEADTKRHRGVLVLYSKGYK